MPSDEKTTTAVDNAAEETTAVEKTTTSENLSSEAVIERERSEKILKAKELYSHGSRNFLVKSYAEAADELSQVCALYGELHGELSDELGMPYLLYAKSLIALALDENKVIDVPDEEEDDEEEDEEAEAVSTNGDSNGEKAEATAANGKKMETIKEDGVDSTEKQESEAKHDSKTKEEEKDEKKPDSKSEEKTESAKSEEKAEAKPAEKKVEDEKKSEDEKKPEDEKKSEEEKKSVTKSETATPMETDEKPAEETQVSSTDEKKEKAEEEEKPTNGKATNGNSSSISVVNDDEKPSTSNGEAGEDAVDEDEENEAASNLQLAWEILELAAKIFTRQGDGGRSNLAEVHTELGNIEFENNVLDSARDDYQKSLEIYQALPANYRRAMAEIHYKIGLSYLMQQSNKEGAASLKEACKLIAGEIEEMKAKSDLTDKDKNNIQDMEETKQEIEAKIVEIEETQAQNIAEVRAALDSYIKPMSSGDVDAGSSKTAKADAAASSTISSSASSATITSSSKPTDISHLIKRKKPEEASSEAEAAVACSPAKRPAV